MTRERGRTDGIAVEFTRPSDMHREQEWDAWCRDEHLEAGLAASGAWVATRWEVADRPPGVSPPVGFTHVTIYEFDDVAVGGPALLDHLEQSRAAGRLHPLHTISAADVLRAASGWPGRREPGPATTGQVIAYVGPNDPAADQEWNEWLAAVHIPDMLGSGAFVDASRWQRVEPARFGPNYLTVYDVEGLDVMEAVALSGQAMGPAHDEGRILTCHSGGIRAALRPAGSTVPTSAPADR